MMWRCTCASAWRHACRRRWWNWNGSYKYRSSTLFYSLPLITRCITGMLQSSVVLVTLLNYLLSVHTILISFLISEIYMKEIKEIIYFSLTCQTAPPSKTPGPEWGWRSCCSQPWGSTPGCRARLKLFFNTLTVASLILFLCCPPTGTNVQFVVEFSLVAFS